LLAVQFKTAANQEMAYFLYGREAGQVRRTDANAEILCRGLKDDPHQTHISNAVAVSYHLR
jgi:hypothetical protein